MRSIIIYITLFTFSSVHFQKCSNFSVFVHIKISTKSFSPPKGGSPDARYSPRLECRPTVYAGLSYELVGLYTDLSYGAELSYGLKLRICVVCIAYGLSGVKFKKTTHMKIITH